MIWSTEAVIMAIFGGALVAPLLKTALTTGGLWYRWDSWRFVKGQ